MLAALSRSNRHVFDRDAGQFVGNIPNGGSGQGFLYSGGVYTTLNVPGATGTYLFGINDAGQIVGGIADGSQFGHSFIYSGGVFTELNVPGAVGTAVNGINNAGQIVGEYFTSPNTGTYLFGINDAGQIVGGIGDGSPTGQSFIAEPTVTPLPAALPLFATGLGALGLLGWRRKRKQVA